MWNRESIWFPSSYKKASDIKLNVKVRDLIKEVEADGWQYIGAKGSHRHYKHGVKRDTSQ